MWSFYLIVQLHAEPICDRKKKQLFYARIFTKMHKEEFKRGTSILGNLPNLYNMDNLTNQKRTLTDMDPETKLPASSDGWYCSHTIPFMLLVIS